MIQQKVFMWAQLTQDLGRRGKFEESLKAAQAGLEMSIQLFGKQNMQTALFYGFVGAGLL